MRNNLLAFTSRKLAIEKALRTNDFTGLFFKIFLTKENLGNSLREFWLINKDKKVRIGALEGLSRRKKPTKYVSLIICSLLWSMTILTIACWKVVEMLFYSFFLIFWRNGLLMCWSTFMPVRIVADQILRDVCSRIILFLALSLES